MSGSRLGAASSLAGARGWLWAGLGWSAAGCLATVSAARLQAAALGTGRLPAWDMAAHGLDGVRLAEHLSQLDALAFLRELNGMSLWPPLFPLLEAPVFLAAGYAYDTPRALMTVLFALSLLAIYRAGAWLADPPELVGLAAALLMATSPLFGLYGALSMLEVPGALLLLLALGSYLAHLRTGRRGQLLATGVLTAALFLCKYNYGLLWMAGLAASELWLAAAGSARALAGLARRAASSVWELRPLRAVLVVYAVAAGAILMVGRTVELGGLRISMRSIANPTIALIWASLLTLLVPRGSRERLRRWYRGLTERQRLLAVTAGAPSLAWLLVPDHVKGLMDTLQTRSSELGLIRGLTYYPLSFVTDYSRSVWLGAAVLAAAAVWCGLAARRGPAERALVIVLLLGFAASSIHVYKQPRFFITLAPLVWLACAALIGGLVRGAGELARVAAVVVVVVAGLGPAWSLDTRRLAADFERITVPAATRAVLDRIADRTRLEGRRVLAGTWNELSPSLVEWHCRQRWPGMDPARLPLLPRRLAPLEPQAQLEAMTSGEDIREVLVLSRPPGAPGVDAVFQENPWLPATLEAMRRSPAFRLVSAEHFEASGYLLWTFSVSRPPRSR